MANKNHIIHTKALTTEEFKILAEVSKDPFAFANYINVRHPTRGRVRFELYPYQRKVLWHFMTERFNIVLKFRQAGITELISLYCLWLAMYHPDKNIVILSLKDRVAKKVLGKIKFMYRHLPDYLKVTITNGRTGELGTASEMEFANGSTIASIPTTEDAGRSEGLSLLVIDEAAIMKWAGIIWAAAFPTLSTGGSAIVNSTPYGVGNWYHKQWVDACSGGNGFYPIRLRWQMHPERDINWYNEQAAALGPRRTAQEIDGDFLTSGASVFDLADIRALEEEFDIWLDVNENPDFKVYMNGQMLIFKNPKPNERYFIGSDVSSGRSRDYSAFSIMNAKGEEFGAFKGKLHPKRLAHVLMDWGKTYNRALIAPEGNDIGLTTVSEIDDSGYPNLYYAKTLLRKKGKKRGTEKDVPGWYTTKENRPNIISGLEEDIRIGTTIIKDPRFTEEAYTFIYNDQNRPVAMGKGTTKDDEDEETTYTDDAIMGKAITNHIRKGAYRSGVYVPPAK